MNSELFPATSDIPVPSDGSVTAIIPTYNSAVGIARCVDSVLGQESPVAQVIVANDGSTDNTAEVVRAYGERVLYLEQPNAGQGAGRNLGLRHATGEFVAFLDADDYWLPGFTKNMVPFLQAHPEAVAASCGFIARRWDGSEYRWPPVGSQEPFAPQVLANFFEFWGRHDHIRTGTALIRRRTIQEAGYQRADLRISQDLEYWALIATYGPWGQVPEPYWIGDPAPVARSQGWIERYRRRRALCPTVEEWEKRLVPRLTEAMWPGFRRVRGRVAAGYAHARIVGGDPESGRHIVRKYGADMPDTWVSRMLRVASGTGTLGWKAAVRVLLAREQYKNRRMERRPMVAAASILEERRTPGAV